MTRRVSLRATVVGVLLVGAGSVVAGGASQAAPAAIDLDNPELCGTCHTTVVAEWERSMHSMSHHDKDPIYGAMRELRMEKQGAEVGERCQSCHNPRSPDDPDTAAGRAGVSCAACHAVESIDAAAGHGALAFTYAEGTLFGPHDLPASASPVHGVGDAPAHMTDGSSLCLACHEATSTPSGAAACTTGPEHVALDGGVACVTCHMPRVEGPSGPVSARADHASHDFFGPHHAWNPDSPDFLGAAVSMSAALSGQTASITLRNQAGHGFPTGFPGRLAVVVVKGLDADGQVVWKNFEADPMAESPSSVLNKVYVNAAGAPVPAAFSESLKRDNRLTPGETRELTYTVPATVAVVEATLVFRLLPPPLAEALSLSEAPEAQAKPIASARATR